MRYTKQAEYENLLSCYPERIEEHLQSVLGPEESVEELTASKPGEDYFHVMPSTTRGEIVDLESDFNISDTVNSKRVERRKRATRTEKKDTNSLYKVADATMSKVRKRKGKVHSSASRSTVVTRDTSYIGKKEAKRRKHRGGIAFATTSPSFLLCFFLIVFNRPSRDTISVIGELIIRI